MIIPLAFIEDYLSDDQAGMLNVITWFLNQVLRHEAGQQAGAGQYERSETRKAHQNGYKGTLFEDPVWGHHAPETTVS